MVVEVRGPGRYGSESDHLADHAALRADNPGLELPEVTARDETHRAVHATLAAEVNGWGQWGFTLPTDAEQMGDWGHDLAHWGCAAWSNDETEAPDDWEEMIALRDQEAVDTWYAENTGYGALGLSQGDLWVPGGGVTFTQAWLESNEGNGHVSFQDGRWLVEAVQASQFRWSANNVTLRGFLVSQGTVADANVGNYALQYFGTTNFNSQNFGAIAEYGEIAATNNPSVGALFHTGNPQGVDTAIMRHVDIHGYRVGWHGRPGFTVEYCWVHDLYYFSNKHQTSGPSHNTAGSVRYPDNTVRRNHFEDGNSAALSLYADVPISNVLVEENILQTANAHYAVNFPGDKEFADETTNTRFINNIFGQKYFSTGGQTSHCSGCQRWTTYSGNTFMDGTAT